MLVVPGIVLAIVVAVVPEARRPVGPREPPRASSNVTSPDAAALRGRVLDEEGEPVAGARVWFSAPGLPALTAGETVADADGSFRFETLGGRARVLVVAEHSARGCAVVGPVEPSASLLVVTLAGPRDVTGTVKAEDGAPIPGAELVVDGSPALTRHARAADDGAYRLGNLANDARAVTVRADGYTTATLPLPGDGTLDVVLKKDEELVGHVIDPDGKGTRAFVRACGGERAEERWTTRPDGTFSVPRSLMACAFVAESDEHAPSLPRTPRDGGLSLELRPGGKLEGRLVDAAGAPVRRFFVAVEAFSPEGREDASVRTGATQSGDDPEGAFRLQKLAPGRYVLAYGPTGGTPARSKPLVVTAGHTTTVTLTVALGGAVTGRVVGSDGQPLPEVQVSLDGAVSGGAMPAGGVTDAAGAFRLEHAPTGVFSVRFAKPGYRTKFVSSLEVPSGGELALPVVTLAEIGDKAAGPEVSGIGGLLKQTRDGVAFGAVIGGSPAERAGVRVGDLVRRIDGDSTGLMSVSEITQRLRGAAGTDVRLTLERDGVRVEVKISRAVVAF